MPNPVRRTTEKSARALESKVRKLKRDLKMQKELAEDWQSKFIYMQAEFENLRKRSSRERDEYVRYANRQILDKLLPLLDDLDSAIDAMKESNREAAQGIEMIRGNLLEILRSEGLEELECLGEPVDPYKHEVVHTISDASAKNNTVAEVVQKGYVHRHKVIRPSKVIAVRNKEE